ncbi:MAG: hypothetical protein AAB459_03925 [Patescibacteria group bacterium]
MHFVRKVLRWLSSAGFKFCLLMVALTASLGVVFASPEPFKQALKQSGIYDKFFTTIFDQANKNAAQNDNVGVSLNDPEIQKIIQGVIPPSKIQTIAEDAIDSVFGYVKTGEPRVIAINLEQEKLAFIDGVANYAEQKILVLPICTSAQLRQLGGEVDPFNAICRPPGFDISKEKQNVKNELLDNKELSFKVEYKLEQEVDKQLNKIANEVEVPVVGSLLEPIKGPGAGRWITNTLGSLPIIFAILALLFALATFLLYEQRRAGLHSVATTFLGNGIFLVLGGIASLWLINTFNKPGGFTDKISGEQASQLVLNNATRNLGIIFNKSLIMYGAIFTVIGLVIVVVMRFFKPKDIDPELKKLIVDDPKNQPKPPTDDSAQIENYKTSTPVNKEPEPKPLPKSE